MTSDEFNESYGPEWMKFKARPIFAAFKSVIDDSSPAKLNAERPPADVLQAGTLWFSENVGHERLAKLITKTLGMPVPKPEPSQSDYSEPEV